MPDPLKPHWFQILLALGRGPMHGTAIMEEVLERTEGAMKLWPATLYGSLRDLEEARLIRETEPAPDAPSEGGRRRFHELTEDGEAVLREELRRMRDILDVARARDLLPDAGRSR
jgi:DNA-binding PadR family transcriptional regulator